MLIKIKYCIVASLIALITSCSKVPNDILSEKKMQEVLTDIYIAEGIISYEVETYNNDSIKQVVFNSVFKKHGVTQAVYDSSMVWYARNLDLFLKIYDRAKIDIDHRIADLGDIHAVVAPASNKDSVDIWPRRTTLNLKPNALFNGVTFDIKPERNYSSGSFFVLGMDVWGISSDSNNHPEIRISVNQGDTIITINEKILNDGYHETILRSVPTKQVRQVYGYIRLDNTDTTYHKIYIDNLNLMKYNYNSEAFQPRN
jgi:hypothetical protein